MPTISLRGKLMPSSPIRKLVSFAEKTEQKGIKVFNLNIGQPDIESSKIGLDAIKENDLRVVEYSHSKGLLSYREKLVQYYKKHTISIDIDDIIVTTGASEAIIFAFISCLNPGEEIIIPEPFYSNFTSFAQTAGINVKPITSFIENDFALPAIDEFEKLITSNTKGIVICNPNNPTGYLYSQKELETLSKIIKKYDLYLFADEVYREFCYDGNFHHSMMNLKGIEQNVLLIDSLSKRYSVCGARIGSLITKNKEIMKTVEKYAQARLSPPTFGQIFGEAAIDTPDEYFSNVKQEYLLRRNLLVQKLNEIEGVYCPTPQGSFYVIAQLPIDDSDHFCQWLLTDFEYNYQTVFLAPATGFYSTKNMGKKEVRIAYVLNVEKLEKAMEVLKYALKKYRGIMKIK